MKGYSMETLKHIQEKEEARRKAIIEKYAAERAESEAEHDIEVETKDIEGETKHEKFLRIARGRYARAAKALQLLGNLGNTAVYEYSDQEVESMFSMLRAHLDTAEAKFASEDEDIGDPFALIQR